VVELGWQITTLLNYEGEYLEKKSGDLPNVSLK
jgi:hypothetical protein